MRMPPLLYALALGWTTVVQARPLIVAHRGASAEAPENTLAALRLAYAQGADAVECDLRMTADGHAVVLHDPSTRRTAGQDLMVALHPLSALKELDVGAWKGSRWRGERIPALDEVLHAVPPGRGLVLELKCGPEIMPELARAFEVAKFPEERLLLIAFDRVVLSAAKRGLPRLKAYWLVSWAKDPKTGEWPRIADLAEKAKGEGFDGLNLNHRFPLDRAAVDAVHAAGLKVAVWTVNDAHLAQRLAEAGVDAITTDKPEWIRRSIRKSVTGAAGTAPGADR